MFNQGREAEVHGFGEPESSYHTSQSSSGAVSFVELRNVLPSSVDIISPFVDQMMRFISRCRKADGDNFEIDLALREALANAIIHGNQEDLQKNVYVKCRCTRDGDVSITIEDEGDGFDSSATLDPTSAGNLVQTHGRGIYLMKKLMDEVVFEQRGSVLHMRKRLTAAPMRPSTESTAV